MVWRYTNILLNNYTSEINNSMETQYVATQNYVLNLSRLYIFYPHFKMLAVIFFTFFSLKSLSNCAVLVTVRHLEVGLN